MNILGNALNNAAGTPQQRRNIAMAANAVGNALNVVTHQTLAAMGVQSHVATEKMSYRAGEVVTGKVWIHSMVPIPMQTVTLKISGFESTKVVEHKYVHDDEMIGGHFSNARYHADGTARVHNPYQTGQIRRDSMAHDTTGPRPGRWVDIPHTQINQILDYDVVVANYAQIVPAGSYAIPFQFVLPEVPGNFRESGTKFEAEISYTISAICNQFGGMGPGLTCSQEFFVEEKLKHIISETAVDNVLNVTSCCCFGKGTCTISAVAKKNAVFPGDVQQAICDVQNESECDIKRVELTIKKDFRVQAGGHREQYSKRVATVSHKGLPKGFCDTKEWNLPIPMDLCPTTNSSLIQSNYRMKIKLVMSGASNVAVDMPLTVYPTSQGVLDMTPPPAWGVDMSQVQVAPLVELQPSAPPAESMVFH